MCIYIHIYKYIYIYIYNPTVWYAIGWYLVYACYKTIMICRHLTPNLTPKRYGGLHSCSDLIIYTFIFLYKFISVCGNVSCAGFSLSFLEPLLYKSNLAYITVWNWFEEEWPECCMLPVIGWLYHWKHICVRRCSSCISKYKFRFTYAVQIKIPHWLYLWDVTFSWWCVTWYLIQLYSLKVILASVK